jgi:hypothetical protein
MKTIISTTRSTTLVVLLVAAAGASAQTTSKPSRADYLQSKVSDATAMCRDQILASAKDPSSIQFPEKYAYGFGQALTRNWIFIYADIMGRNTYGAVLKHSMTCTISCKQGKPCSWVSLTDQ